MSNSNISSTLAGKARKIWPIVKSNADRSPNYLPNFNSHLPKIMAKYHLKTTQDQKLLKTTGTMTSHMTANISFSRTFLGIRGAIGVLGGSYNWVNNPPLSLLVSKVRYANPAQLKIPRSTGLNLLARSKQRSNGGLHAG